LYHSFGDCANSGRELRFRSHQSKKMSAKRSSQSLKYSISDSENPEAAGPRRFLNSGIGIFDCCDVFTPFTL
jgi:hypothetical protein